MERVKEGLIYLLQVALRRREVRPIFMAPLGGLAELHIVIRWFCVGGNWSRALAFYRAHLRLSVDGGLDDPPSSAMALGASALILGTPGGLNEMLVAPRLNECGDSKRNQQQEANWAKEPRGVSVLAANVSNAEDEHGTDND